MLLDDVGQLQPAPVGGLVELEVDRPDLIGPLSSQPLGLLGSDPAAFAGPDRAAQALLAPLSSAGRASKRGSYSLYRELGKLPRTAPDGVILQLGGHGH